MTQKLSFILVTAALFLAPATFRSVSADEFITGTQARQLIAEKGAILIDVRTPDEYKERHVPGALFFQVQELQKDMFHLGDFNRPMIVYCRSGMRAAKAKEMLTAAGFKDVYNMGGIDNWDH